MTTPGADTEAVGRVDAMLCGHRDAAHETDDADADVVLDGGYPRAISSRQAVTMMTPNEMTRRDDDLGSPLATDFSGFKIGFDDLDQLALDTIPKLVLGDTAAVLTAQLNALVVEGSRGPAARRLLAREVTLARAALRFREAIANIELERLARGRGDARRVALLEQLVAGGHRRLMAAVDRLARLDAAPVPQLHVTARVAQVAVTGGAR